MICVMTFENSVKNKNTFFIKQDISFLKKKKKNCLGIFFAEADSKKHRYASAEPSAFADCRGEFRTLY